VGKSSVVRGIRRRTGIRFSVSATTRPPRPGEQDGVDYFFVHDATFDRMIRDGDLLEWAEYGGHRYGTPRRAVRQALDAGEDILLDIENEGAKQVKAAFPDAIAIFLVPPTMEELERRLRRRGDTSEEDVRRRLAVARAQIEEAPRVYDAIVVNDDLEAAIDRVVAILAAPSSPADGHGASGRPDPGVEPC